MAGDRPPEVRALRHALLNAEDDKIRGVVALVDQATDASINAAILDPVRPRLALIRPPRTPRLPRVLFIPLDPVIVPARAWREDRPAVPRSVLPGLAQLVRTKIGPLANEIDERLAAHRDPASLVTDVGALLWPRAAEVLDATNDPPPAWEEAGLRASAFRPLIRAIASVLRRGPVLRAMGLSDPGSEVVNLDGLLENLAAEPELGHAMIVRVLLRQAPRAAEALWRMVNAGWSAADRATLRKAMASGREEVLADLEAEGGFAAEIGRGSLAAAAEETRRTVALLSVLADDPISVRDRPRVASIRRVVDDACRARILCGIEDEIAAPLAAASGQVDSASQTRLEASARALRSLDLAARPSGQSSDYDALLDQAVTAIAEAADVLTLVRRCRLVEILAGPEAAEALYDPLSAGAGRAPGSPARPEGPHPGS